MAGLAILSTLGIAYRGWRRGGADLENWEIAGKWIAREDLGWQGRFLLVVTKRRLWLATLGRPRLLLLVGGKTLRGCHRGCGDQ
jgi:hypothetical protein